MSKSAVNLELKSDPGKQANARAQQKKTSPHPQPSTVGAPREKKSADAPRSGARDDDGEPELPELLTDSEDDSFSEACRQEKWEAVRKRRLERQKREGELLEAAEVRQAWGDMVSSARAQLLLLPAKLAPRVAHLKDARECQVVIDEEVRSLLTSLSEFSPESNN